MKEILIAGINQYQAEWDPRSSGKFAVDARKLVQEGDQFLQKIKNKKGSPAQIDLPDLAQDLFKLGNAAGLFKRKTATKPSKPKPPPLPPRRKPVFKPEESLNILVKSRPQSLVVAKPAAVVVEEPIEEITRNHEVGLYPTYQPLAEMTPQKNSDTGLIGLMVGLGAASSIFDGALIGGIVGLALGSVWCALSRDPSKTYSQQLGQFVGRAAGAGAMVFGTLRFLLIDLPIIAVLVGTWRVAAAVVELVNKLCGATASGIKHLIGKRSKDGQAAQNIGMPERGMITAASPGEPTIEEIP